MDVQALLAQPMEHTCAREPLTDALWAELEPLLFRHYLAISAWKDVPLEPDRAKYDLLERAGVLRIFTARQQGCLIGYVAFLVDAHLHYRRLTVASQDVLWIEPEHRHGALGSELMDFAERVLEVDGVHVILQHSKVAHPIGGFLRRLGYEAMDTIYAKRITPWE